MTSEEMERAIEFLLESQAKSEHRLEEMSRQLMQTGQQISTLADSQNDLTLVVTRHIETQTEINATLRDSMIKTDARLDRLAETVERFIAGQGDQS